MIPWDERDQRLTGGMRARRGNERTGLFSSAPVLILQVEEKYFSYPAFDPEGSGKHMIRWRDMRTTDLPLLIPLTPVASP